MSYLPKIGRMNTKKTGSAKAATETIALESINVLTPGSAPVALKLARIGGIGETVDGSVSWDRSRCSISPGIVAETLVSALLCGCRALYNMKSFWEESGCAAWFERNGVVPEQLNDDVYARLLDRFSECDMRKIVETGVCQPTCRFSGVKVSRALPSFSGLSHTVCASSRFLTARPFHRSGCFLFASSRTSFLALRIAADSPR